MTAASSQSMYCAVLRLASVCICNICPHGSKTLLVKTGAGKAPAHVQRSPSAGELLQQQLGSGSEFQMSNMAVSQIITIINLNLQLKGFIPNTLFQNHTLKSRI